MSLLATSIRAVLTCRAVCSIGATCGSNPSVPESFVLLTKIQSKNLHSPPSSISWTSSRPGDRQLPIRNRRLLLQRTVPNNTIRHRSHSTSTNPKLTSKVAIIGTGDVGSTIAYSLVLNPITGDVLLVDPDKDFCSAQAQDLSDATYHGNTATRVRTATHKEAGQCDIIVMTAGAAQKQGESRTDLIGKNLKILESAIEDCKPFRKDAILLVVANPVDVLTQFAQRFSGLPKAQVVGSGTFLDSARLRGDLASQTGVAASSIDAYVLGEHGETQVAAWSQVGVGGVPLHELGEDQQIDKAAMAEGTKQKAAAIVQSKGATAFGVGGVAASLCKSILFDQRNIRPVSFWQEGLGVCLSMPAVIGREGIVRGIPMSLTDQEQSDIKASAKSLREIVEEAEKNHSSQ